MLPNYDFLEIGDKKRFDYERVLLSAELVRFPTRGDPEHVQIVITRSKFFVVRNELIDRDVPLSEIEAVTTSINSDEFVIHVEDSVDERFSSVKNKAEILQMILYLQTTPGSPVLKPSTAVDPAFKMKVYMVPDLSLDIYLTTPEDIEAGHVVRPDERHRRMLNYKEFLELETKYAERKEARSRSTRTLYTKEGSTKITIEDFELIKTLGKGAHGKVLLCERRDGRHERYAMKIIKKQHIIDSNQIEHTIAEKVILSRLTHPFLVSLKHAFQNEHKIYFVMEFMKGGELFQHLRKVKRFTEEQTRFIAACIITALGHLHNKDYIYRDLKPENVLLDEKGFAKLTDFGLAKNLTVGDVAKTFCGTPEYLAPEIILDKGCNRPADWWSLGVLVYEMLFGLPPFYSKDVQEMYKKTLLNPLRFSSKIMISPEAKDFIAGLLVKAPSKRLGSIADSLEVMSHPWFKDFNWARLLDRNITPPYNPSVAEWERNFDPGFTKEPPKDSICSADPNTLFRYKSQFRIFDDRDDSADSTEEVANPVQKPVNEGKEEPQVAPLPEPKPDVKPEPKTEIQIVTPRESAGTENEGSSIASRFKETMKREASKSKGADSSPPTPMPKLYPIDGRDCTKKLNFGEEDHKTPDTMSDLAADKGHPGKMPKATPDSRNSFEITDEQLCDFEEAFNNVTGE